MYCKQCYQRIDRMKLPKSSCDDVMSDYFTEGMDSVPRRFQALMAHLANMCVDVAKYRTEVIKTCIDMYDIKPNDHVSDAGEGWKNPLRGVLGGVKKAIFGAEANRHESSKLGEGHPSLLPPGHGSGGTLFKYRRPRL